MKSKSPARLTLLLLLIVLAGCAPPPTATAEPARHEIVTPQQPPGTTFLDACTHTVSYPPELEPDDAMGWIFVAPEDPDVVIFIEPRRRLSSEEGKTLAQIAAALAEGYGANEAVAFESTTLTDFVNQPLDGLQGEFETSAGIHFRLLVVLQPNTLLVDAVADDVIFEVYAQAPAAVWDEWIAPFDILFDNLHPSMCGGV